MHVTLHIQNEACFITKIEVTENIITVFLNIKLYTPENIAFAGELNRRLLAKLIKLPQGISIEQYASDTVKYKHFITKGYGLTGHEAESLMHLDKSELKGPFGDNSHKHFYHYTESIITLKQLEEFITKLSSVKGVDIPGKGKVVLIDGARAKECIESLRGIEGSKALKCPGGIVPFSRVGMSTEGIFKRLTACPMGYDSNGNVFPPARDNFPPLLGHSASPPVAPTITPPSPIYQHPVASGTLPEILVAVLTTTALGMFMCCRKKPVLKKKKITPANLPPAKKLGRS